MARTTRVKNEDAPKTYNHRASPGPVPSAANEIVPLQFNGVGIHERGEMLSLTDMWKAAGADQSKRPVEWLRSKDAQAFCEHLELMVGNSHLFEVGRGRSSATFAHWQVGLAYAKYLSPEFHLWCNKIVRSYMEGRVVPVAGDTELDVRTNGIVRSIRHEVAVMKQQNAELVAVVSSVKAELQDMMDRANRRIGSLEYIPVLDVLKEHDIPAKGRRGLSQRCSTLLRRYSLLHEHPMRESGETGRWLYHVDAIKGWLKEQGLDIFRRHKAKLAGDGELFRVVEGGKAAS